MPALPYQQRLRIVMLHEEHRSYAQISKQLRIDRSTVRRWVRRYDQSGSVDLMPASGRPRYMVHAATERALELLLSKEAGGLRFVAKKIFSEGLTPVVVSPATVSRAVKAMAAAKGDTLRCLRGRPPKLMTGPNREKRKRFATRHLSNKWRDVMITDRCKFHFRYPGTRVQRSTWVLRSQKHEHGAFKPNRPSCYNVYGGITMHGVTKLHPVTGTTGLKTQYTNMRGEKSKNITAAEYRDVVGQTLLKEGRRLFSAQGMSAWVLQQDGDPTHRAAQAVVDSWNEQRGQGTVSILPGWPGNSPDLSPIENVWAWVDAQVAAKGCQNFQEFCHEIDQTFQNIPKEMLQNLFASIPRRLQKCIENDGHKTGW